MAKNETRSKIAISTSALKRLALWHLFSTKLDLVLLTEFPKSGGTWLSKLIASYLKIPFPENESAKFEKALLHGHHVYHPNFHNLICLNRDGRDILVSYYYHMFSGMKEIKSSVVNDFRKNLNFKDYQDTKANLPKYIEYMFTQYNKGKFRFSWSEFVQSFYGKEDVIHVKYEDLLADAPQTLNNILVQLNEEQVDIAKVKSIVNRFSFKNQTNRKPGEEDTKSFLRKGIAGDWKNHFSPKACQVFDHYAGKELIHLGYEKDHNWY